MILLPRVMAGYVNVEQDDPWQIDMHDALRDGAGAHIHEGNR